MSWWRLRDPGSFPPEYHAVIRAGVGKDKVIGHYVTQRALNGARKDWRLFMYCLRRYPGHPTAVLAAQLDHRTSEAYDHGLRAFAFRLTSQPKVFAELTRMG